MNKNRSITLVFLLFVSIGRFYSQADTLHSSCDTLKNKPEKKYFELSFGSTLLFISNSKLEEIKKNEAVIVPTSALLFFAELRPIKKLKIPIFFNFPTETKQFLVNGQLVNERASPTFGIGLEFRIFKLPINKKSAVELEIGPLASFLQDTRSTIRFAPVAAGRFRFIKNDDFVIYLGSSYSAGINAVGLLFGTGYIF